MSHYNHDSYFGLQSSGTQSSSSLGGRDECSGGGASSFTGPSQSSTASNSNDILANIFKKLNSISSGSQTASNGLNLRFGSQSEQGASDAEAECILRSFFLHIFCMGWQESSNWICEEDEFDKVDKKFVQAEIADWIDKEIKVNKFRVEIEREFGSYVAQKLDETFGQKRTSTLRLDWTAYSAINKEFPTVRDLVVQSPESLKTWLHNTHGERKGKWLWGQIVQALSLNGCTEFNSDLFLTLLKPQRTDSPYDAILKHWGTQV